MARFDSADTCSVDGHAMIWRSSPLYSSCSRACSLWNTCWMLFCGQTRDGGKKKGNHKKPTCYRALGAKLIRHFHLPSVPPRYLVSMSTVCEVLFFVPSSGRALGRLSRHVDGHKGFSITPLNCLPTRAAQTVTKVDGNYEFEAAQRTALGEEKKSPFFAFAV